jgi:hypothetical protein
MRLTRELVSAFVVLIIAYLVLIHYTGFAKDIGSIGENAGSLAKTFQGR